MKKIMKNRFIIFPVMCILLFILCASPEIKETTAYSEMTAAGLLNTAGANRHIAENVVLEPTIEKEEAPIVQQAATEEASIVQQPDPYEVYLMAHLIYGEAGDQKDDCQRAVGAVVLNRVKHKIYPDTIEEVIFQEGQYACTEDGNFDREPSEQAWKNAYWLLENELSEDPIQILPANVIFQSQFEQGDGAYAIIGSETFSYLD